MRITIGDDGPGVPDEFIAHLGQRGRRLDERRTGNGLGIAIATEIVAAAGGGLEWRNSEQGFEVVIDLPMSAHRSW